MMQTFKLADLKTRPLWSRPKVRTKDVHKKNLLFGVGGNLSATNHAASHAHAHACVRQSSRNSWINREYAFLVNVIATSCFFSLLKVVGRWIES
jgi:hypothetical protein